MLRRTFLPCLLLAVLTACTPATATPVPVYPPTPTRTQGVETSTPFPTDVEASATPEFIPPTPEYVPATETEPATQTVEPFPTLSAPVVTMVSTAILQPKVDAGTIQLLGPGPMSKVVSPIAIYGYAVPGYNNSGRVDLYGEDGRLLATEKIQLNTSIKWAYFNIGLSFDVAAAGELGRLVLSTQDQYGRLTAVYSVHLLLMPEGMAIINPPGNLKERIVLDQPAAGKRISGGVLGVVGRIRPFSASLLVVELIGRDGVLLGSQLVAVNPAPDDSYVSFRVDVPYSVSTGTWARLTVRQPDDRISGTMYLYSQEILLNP